jgi:DNA-binding cell septation regulator SpoVG
MQPKHSMLILIAGPYRSGTNDDPERIHANVKAMTDMALEVYKMGHLPVLGEWFALPLIEAAGSKKTGDKIFNDIFHPVAVRLIEHCDAVLRIGGQSSGADEMISAGRERGKTIFFDKSEIPRVFKES